MDIRQFLDSTYLKTAEQAGVSKDANAKIVRDFVTEAIEERFKAVMIRPEYVAMAKELIASSKAMTSVGTVIDFPAGTAPVSDKLEQAQQAIDHGADELDFVVNYEAFKAGETSFVKDEILQGTKLAIENFKVCKWIIETAALSGQQIMQLSALIKNVVLSNFKEEHYNMVFVKSSTGFYATDNGVPNGATTQDITLMLENAAPLPVKASGGIRSFDDAVAMINLGVKRIGTSSAKAIVNQQPTDSNY
ncbi:MAG TPA: deoxyribose-phosphate aldolase [Flavobacterium sp.]|jgi:deoxyribose-phosphate aldolase